MIFKSLLALIAGMAFSATAPAEAADPGTRAGGYETAVFAGGCFWCVESDFDSIPGVVKTISGYTGGHTPNPTYEEVSAGGTGHAESVQVVFDPAKISYQELVEKFWRMIDPTTLNRQFCDSGNQYRTAIFYNGPRQKTVAELSKQALEKNKPFKEKIVTEITPATEFYPAEDYHQDYHAKNPVRYRYYRYGCGRDRRLEQLWGSPR